MTTEPGPARLSPRQRQCLALVYERRTSKEIAIELGIDRSTVDNYIAEAVRLLGARNRRDAAERVAAAPPCPPGIIEDRSSRVDAPPLLAPEAGLPARRSLSLRLPLRPTGAAHNELVTLERLAWIPAIAIALATGFGMLVVGLRIIGDLVIGLAHGH